MTSLSGLLLSSISLEQRFSTQITPRPVFWRKKFPRPEIEDPPFIIWGLDLSYFQQKNLYNSLTTTRLKSSTTRRLRNAGLEEPAGPGWDF